MVIEEPAPPAEPKQVSTPNVTPEKPARPHRHVARTEQPPSTEPSDTDESSETAAPPPAEVPALEPRESSAQVSALRQQVQSLQEDVRARLSRINESKLSQEDRKTLDDARTFFAQSNHALEQGDLQRALLLARKASLLVAALEQ
jgi:outer membrane biosynthesis protein TonB